MPKARVSKTGTAPNFNESQNHLLHIQTMLDSMPRSYQKIAQYILNNPEHVSHVSITQLAKKIGTCCSTITRFSQSLGFSGFSQLKHDIERASLLALHQNQNIGPNDSVITTKQKLMPRYIQGLENAMKGLSVSKMDYIANVIPRANKVYFFAHGGSGISAMLGQIMFMQIGLPAVAFTEISTSAMASTQMRNGDVAFGISSSGFAKTPVDALRIARENGAITVGITGFPRTPLANQSKVLFCYNTALEDIRLIHVNRLCEAAILGVLLNCILNKNYERMSQNLQLAKDAFMSARYF